MFIAFAYLNDSFITGMLTVLVSEESALEKHLSHSHLAKLKAKIFI